IRQPAETKQSRRNTLSRGIALYPPTGGDEAIPSQYSFPRDRPPPTRRIAMTIFFGTVLQVSIGSYLE
ncbi:hypothetical protein CO015_04125, partial [candidate division WWE3 bacterium CG_4_8_14_3_um_filter_42_11]